MFTKKKHPKPQVFVTKKHFLLIYKPKYLFGVSKKTCKDVTVFFFNPNRSILKNKRSKQKQLH